MERTSTSVVSSKQQARANRILDVAADLLLRWGYKRVTIQEVASRAGIGAGTIYLHWKTREALFETVLLREMVIVWRTLIERLRTDPEEIFPHRMMSSLLLIVVKRPLAHALATGAQDVLGALAGHGFEQAMLSQETMIPQEFWTQLSHAGLLRPEENVAAQSYAFRATVTGFFTTAPSGEGEEQLPPDERARMLAQTIRRAFEPEILPEKDALQAVASRSIAWLEQACEICEQHMRQKTPNE
ncbi:MAG: TetR/AcrR family transcriptional regulator [Ktedonobacteraceae bacterium]|nr:TetR/AcrR family transcriptional regulator [Ktedonobacteraceae bacterium]MBO0789416.1 TetR/AcrR family transcriptional regulator [Ktedonobacteraceae bacterium]